jgi:antitoxin (DNA-binding transcriptional repressor) of toxin-antitoxin stability system
MIQIRPVSDLRNKFPEIEKLVNLGEPVFLTKNGLTLLRLMCLNQSGSLNRVYLMGYSPLYTLP